MSRYGIDVYGGPTAFYGATSLVDLQAHPFVVRSLQHGELALSWTNPTGDYDRLRVVRSSYGVPVNADDGTAVYDVARGAAPQMTDTGLSQGAFYYYAIFVRKAVGFGYQWLPAAAGSGLVVQDYGYTELLLERLPSIYSTEPASTATRADQASLVERFLSLFGFQLDQARTVFRSLGEAKNADRAGSQLLPLLARELGQVYEPEIGERQMRVLLRNTVYLYKKKGTAPAVTGLVSSLTGWGADILPLTNLVLDEDTASAEGSVGHWHVRSGPGVLSRRASDALVNDEVIPAGAVVGYRNAAYSNTSRGMFQLTESGAGTVVLATVDQADPLGALRTGIPIDPTKPVSASVFVRHVATSRVPTVALDFYDRRGALLAAPTATNSTGATATDWTRRNSTSVATPPATARYVGVRLTYPVTATDEVQLFDAVQVEQSAAPTGYRAARSVRISLTPSRVNLTPNPGLEVDLTGWTYSTGTAGSGSLVRTTTSPIRGNGSGLLTKGTSFSYASWSPVLAPNTTYTVSATVRMSTAGNVRLVSREGGTGVEAYRALALTPVGTTATRLSWTYTTGGTVVSPSLSLGWESGEATTGVTLTFDDVLVEPTAFVLPYFDGSTVGSLDYGWTGTPHASSSVLYLQRAVRDSRLRANIDRYLQHGTHYELVYADGYEG